MTSEFELKSLSRGFYMVCRKGLIVGMLVLDKAEYKKVFKSMTLK